MPNKTIYVSDDDVWLFDRAQELNNGNLSSAVARALQRFVELEEAQMKGHEEVTVRVGRGGARRYKRFVGQRLARWRHRGADENRYEVYTVYKTRKDNYAVHTKVRTGVDWKDPESWFDSDVLSGADWKDPETWLDPQTWSAAERQFRSHRERFSGNDLFGGGDATLDVYSTFNELATQVPPELAEMVREADQEPEVETLDI